MICVEQGHHGGGTRNLERDRYDQVDIGRYLLGNESVHVLVGDVGLLSLFISLSVT
jgi:hypothetical protein